MKLDNKFIFDFKMEKTQKSCDLKLPEQSYLEAVFPDMKHGDEESDTMSAKIPMATLGACKFWKFFPIFVISGFFKLNLFQIKWKNVCP